MRLVSEQERHAGRDHLLLFVKLGEDQAAREAYRKGIEVAGSSRREQQRKAEVQKKLDKK